MSAIQLPSPQPVPDAELLRQAQRDPEGPGFQELYGRYYTPVFRYLLRLVHERDLAEDLLQETFFRVYQHLDRCDPDRPFEPWLYSIARNAGLNALRIRKKAVGDPSEEPSTPADGVVEEVAEREQVDAAGAALASLPDETRALLLQRHGLGMKLSEMAGSWEVTERTIRNRLHTACAALAKAIVARRTPGGTS